MSLYEHRPGVRTHWISFENSTLESGRAGLENQGAKGHAFDSIRAGETKTLLAVACSGLITRMWMTIDNRSAEMLRSLRLEMFWDGSDTPAVSVPLGDFFMAGLGRMTPFENALCSNPEGRSFNSCIPMPFRSAARVTLTNDSDEDLLRLFYDIDLVSGVQHSPETLYFHALWRRENPNQLGAEFALLPAVSGRGRFLGTSVGVQVNPAYEGSWWGEGEVKVRFGGSESATLCGTGTEDYIGTGWGQGTYAHRAQGCLIADKEAGQYTFYRLHLDDPIFFDDGCQVGIQTIGGTTLAKVREFMAAGLPVVPVTIDPGVVGGFVQLLDGGTYDLENPDWQDKWCNFWRQDDWSAVSYFYLDSAAGTQGLVPVAERTSSLPHHDNAWS